MLAIVSRPAFDPNLFVNGISGKDWAVINNNPYYPMDNKAITGEYPPGSTFKIITNRIAYLSWFMYPMVLVYPYLQNESIWHGQRVNHHRQDIILLFHSS